MHPDGRVVHYSGDSHAMDINGTRYAIGSGADFAPGAMHADKSAAVAVKIAFELDPNSGLPMEVVKGQKV